MLTREEMQELVDLVLGTRLSVVDELNFWTKFDDKYNQLHPHLFLNQAQYFPNLSVQDSGKILDEILMKFKSSSPSGREEAAAQEIAKYLETINPLLYPKNKYVLELQKQLFELNKYIYSFADQSKVAELKKDYASIVKAMNMKHIDKQHALDKIHKMKDKYHQSFGVKVSDYFRRIADAVSHFFESIKYSLCGDSEYRSLINERVSASRKGVENQLLSDTHLLDEATEGVNKDTNGELLYNISLFGEYTRRNNTDKVLECAEKIVVKF